MSKKPKEVTYIKAVDAGGKEKPGRWVEKKGPSISVIVVDETSKVLHGVTYDVQLLSDSVKKAQKKGASEIFLARELAMLGDDDGRVIGKLVRDRMVTLEKSKKKGRKG